MDRLLDQQHQPLDAKDWSITTTRLPSELWFLILRYATYPPFPWSSVSSASHFSTTSLCSSDHHQQNSTTIPFHVRLANYNSELQWKASLTRVCKEWNMWGQEFLWEDVWIASARDGRFLVDIICGRDRCHAPLAADAITTKWGSHTEVRAVGKEKKKRLGFSLKRSRDLQPPSGSQSSALIPHGRLARTPVTSSRQPHPQNRSKRKNVASYIKKLYIETPSMDKCCSIDLLFILERCERLEVFVDLRSVRTGFGFVGVQTVGGLDWSQKGNVKKNAPPPGGPGTIPQRHLFPPSRIPTITPDPILQALLRQKPTLKHLTFTNYKYDSDDFEGGVWFWEDVVGSALSGGNRDGSNLAATLGSLEVVMSTRGVGMGNGRRRLDDHRNPFALSSTPSRRFEDGLLTSLNIDVNPSPLSLSLPSLHSLRIPLTSPTLLVISTWSLPSLQSLCVVSIDFTGWRRMGFKKLMDVHGGGLLRFEIVGGGESVEEEGWITEREDALYGVGHPTNHPRYQHLHLPSTSPNLKHFICSSNASEWNWETPDWIAPHVLMPEHFGVEMIGVWGLEGRVIRGGDWEEGRGGGGSVGAGMGAGSGGRGNDVRGLRRRTINTWTTSRWNGQHSTSSDDSSYTLRQDEEENQHEFEERPFFMLQEQFGSLLRREAFPSLVCIRDMSWESDLIRRSVGIGCGLADSSPSPVADPIPNANAKTETKKLKTKYSLASLKETVASRFAGLTTTPTASSSGSPSPASSSTLTASPTMNASLYRPRTQAQYSKIRKFWLGVLEMCDRRGVYLEDWMGRRVVA
ncbi:hypothetical protein BYT27DRAFT_7191829 [Phlegmacium glaucopus]|nr:hypothetical protein BYT27DRAFT_7191829 [Phlegmacium glaucopus]